MKKQSCFQLLLNHPWWQPEADLSCDSTLNLHAAVGAGLLLWADTLFYLSVSFIVITCRQDVCVYFTVSWNQKTWLGHLSNLLTLQAQDKQPLGTFRTPARPGARTEGCEGKQIFYGKLMGVKAQPASVFFLKMRPWVYTQWSLSFLMVCLSGQGHSNHPTISSGLGVHRILSSPSTFRPANKMPIIADPPPPPAYLRKHWSPRKEPVPPVDSALRASGKSEDREVLSHPPEDWSSITRKG